MNEIRDDYIKFFEILVEVIVLIEIFVDLIDLLNVVGVVYGLYVRIKVFIDSVLDYFSCY